MLRYETIQSAEVLHQQRLRRPFSELRRWGRFWRTIDIALRVFAVISALALVLIELLTALFYRDLQSPSRVGFVFLSLIFYLLPLFILLPYTLLFYLRLTIRTLALSTDSLVREKRIGTWDFLKLSNINARDLVIGKLLATLRSTAFDTLLLMVLRIGVVTWFGLTRPRIDLIEFPYFNLSQYYDYGQQLQLQPQYLLLAVGLVIVYTLLGGLLTMACGIFVGVFLKRPYFWLAWLLRTVMLIGIVIAMFFFAPLVVDYYDPYGNAVFHLVNNSAATLMDNGTIMIMQIAGATRYPYEPERYYFPAVILTLVIYSGLIAGLSWLTVRAMRNQGM